MYIQFASTSMMVAGALCVLGFVFCFMVRNRPPALRHLMYAFLFQTVLVSASCAATMVLHPAIALHRWITSTAALLCAVHVHQFFLQFPSPILGRWNKIIYRVELLVALLVSGWFILETQSAPKIFHFDGHYWDLAAPLQGQVVASVMLLILALAVATSIAQAVRHRGHLRVSTLGILAAFLLLFYVPAVALGAFRLGKIPASVFANAFGFASVGGFFFFHVFFAGYRDLEIALRFKVGTVVIAILLVSTQIVGSLFSEMVDRTFDLRQSLSAAQTPPNSVPEAAVYIRRNEDVRLGHQTVPDHPWPGGVAQARTQGARGYSVTSAGQPVVTYVLTSGTASSDEVAFPYEMYRAFVHHTLIGHLLILIPGNILLLIGFGYFIRLSIVLPLRTLLVGMDSVEGGNLTTELQIQSKDEIGLLTRAFNGMVKTLRDTRQELQQYTANLERKILERDSIFDAVPSERQLSNRAFVYASRSMQAVVERVERIAQRDQPVLITGETGTGKELIAMLLHEIGRGPEAPFVPINCAAVPGTLWESQIFGHARGAFTDAKSDYAGAVAEAGEGTLFFDEVGEMPLEIQPKILRLLQERKFKHVGGKSELVARCRIIFATHRNLRDMVAKGQFREDLFYRINVFEINIPPLRERRSDIRLLINRFIEEYGKQNGTVVDFIEEVAIEALLDHSWNGNVRELENTIIKALANVRGDRISLADLPPDLGQHANRGDGAGGDVPINGSDPAGFEMLVSTYSRRLIEAALHHCEGNKSEAARILKISRGKLQYQMKALKMEE